MSNSNIYLKTNLIFSPVNGNIIDIENIPDQIFNKKIIGDGLAVKPSDGNILSPCNGIIEYILAEKHAIFMSCENKTSLLLHIGLDTVEMNGKGFNCLVTPKQKIKIGDPLINIDLKKISEHNKDDTIILVIPKNNNVKIIYKNSGKSEASKTILFTYKKYFK